MAIFANAELSKIIMTYDSNFSEVLVYNPETRGVYIYMAKFALQWREREFFKVNSNIIDGLKNDDREAVQKLEYFCIENISILSIIHDYRAEVGCILWRITQGVWYISIKDLDELLFCIVEKKLNSIKKRIQSVKLNINNNETTD